MNSVTVLRHQPAQLRAPGGAAGRRRGQILVLFALLLPVLATGAVLALDAGYWMIQKRQLQYAVDAAAMVGSQGINETTTSKQTTTVVDKAEAWLQENIAFPAGVTSCQEDHDDGDDDDDDETLTTAQFCSINHGPQNGIYASGSKRFRYVEVVVTAPAQSVFYHMFRGLGFGTFFAEPTIRVRAVAGGVQPIIFALLVTGTSSVSACGNNPICLGGAGGGGTISGNLCSNGGIGVSGTNSTVTGTVVGGGDIQSGLQGTTGTVSTAAGNLDSNPACPTPPCALTTSYWAGLGSNGAVSVAAATTLSPGRYTSLTINTAAAADSVTLNPGVYYIDGNFDFSKGTIPAVTGVTFIVGGDFLVTNNASMGSSTSSRVGAVGSTSGAPSVPCNMLVYLLESGTNNKVTLKSNDPLYLAGAIYAPDSDSEVEIGGAGGGSMDLLGQILAYKAQVQGTGTAITYDYENTSYIPKPYLAE